MFVLEIVWFLLAFSFAALGLARRLLWCAVQVAVWKKSSGQMPVLNASWLLSCGSGGLFGLLFV